MKLLREIFHQDNLNTEGKTIHREAVRGIIIKEGQLLMIYSPKNGDYKFPGGGVDQGERYEDTLIREIQEECGAMVSRIEREFGSVIEYNKALDDGYDVFKMTSRYYICHIDRDGGFGEQRLDDYEEALGFRPVWIDVNAAIQTNRAVLNSPHRKAPRWTARDTFVLEQVKEWLFT